MGTPNGNDPDTPQDAEDRPDRAAPKPGSGKQFSKDVRSPGRSEPTPKGSGKQFTPSNKRNGNVGDDEDDEPGR